MKWIALIRFFLDLISNLEAQGKINAQAIDWSRLVGLLKYVPEIVDLLQRMIEEYNGQPGISFDNEEVARRFVQGQPMSEAQRFDFARLIQLIMDNLPAIIEIIRNMDDKGQRPGPAPY